jgi:hypothetical protein
LSVCFFEEGGPLFAGASKVGREERSRNESDDTSYDVFVGRFETSVFQSRGSDARRKKKRVSSFSLFPRARNRTCESGKSRSGDVPRCTFGNPHGLLVGVFGRSREMNDARRVPRQKKSTRASLHGKGVEREARPRDAPRRTPRHARIARARDTRSRRSLVSWLSVPRGFHTHLSTDRARRRDCRGSRDAFLARPTLARSVARFLRTRFRLANSEDAAVRRR